MADVTARLDNELSGATEQATNADSLDQVLAALDRFTALIVALDNTRMAAGAQTRRLIATALRYGIDPRDLYGRPFSGTIVRAIAKENDIELAPPGPRPRRLPRSA